MTHLCFDYFTARMGCGEGRPAPKYMQDVGITYQYSTPQSMGECFWFWNCENIPAVLPEFITELKLDPLKAVGHGLTKEEAENIRDYQELHRQ